MLYYGRTYGPKSSSANRGPEPFSSNPDLRPQQVDEATDAERITGGYNKAKLPTSEIDQY
jgi:hypothetical protein